MRAFRNELYKLYGGRTFIFMALLLIGINSALLYADSPDKMVAPGSFRKAYTYIEGMPEPERTQYIRDGYAFMEWIAFFMDSNAEAARFPDDFALFYKRYESGDYLRFTEDSYREYCLFRELKTSLEQIETYPDYLRDIHDRAEKNKNVAIFSQKDPFSLRNAEMTSRAYKQLGGNVPQFTNSRSFLSATDFIATDFFLITLLFYAVVKLVIFEKENGLIMLVKPLAKGRGYFISAKAGVLLFSSTLFAILFFGTNLLLSTAKYGAINMGACLQSINGFEGSALNVTILQYLIVFLISKIIVFFLIGMAVLYFALVSKSVVMIYVRTIALFALSFVLYRAVDGNSPFQALKYLNIVNFVQVTPIYRYYFNLNVFSYPVNIIVAFALICTLLCAQLFLLNIFFFIKHDSVITLKSRSFFQKKRPAWCITSLARHEAYKLFIVQKAALILFFFSCFQGYLILREEPYMSVDEHYYKSYMQSIGGEVTDRTREIVNRERERLMSFSNMADEAQQGYDDERISLMEFEAIQKLASDNTRGQAAFMRVLERLSYAEGLESPWIVYDTGYEKLTGNSYEAYDLDMSNAVVLLVAMIATFSAFFATEFSTGMNKIVSCCKYGQRNTVKTKLRVSIPLLTILFLIAYAPEFLSICKQYSLPYADARLTTIPSLAGFTVDMKLWQYLTLIYLYRYAVFISILLFLFLISSYIKNTISTISVSSVLFVVPAFLHMTGLYWVDYFSINSFLSGNMLLNNWHGVASVLLMLFPLALSAFSYVRLMIVFD